MPPALALPSGAPSPGSPSAGLPPAASLPARLETARLVLRQFGPADVDAYAALRADPVVMRFLPGGAARAARAVEEAPVAIAAFTANWARDGYGPWAVEDRRTGALLGHLGLRRLGPELSEVTELLFLLRRDAWGQGLATEGGRAACDAAFGVAGLDRVHGFVLPENGASRRVLGRLGFVEEGMVEAFGLRALRCVLHRPAARTH